MCGILCRRSDDRRQFVSVVLYGIARLIQATYLILCRRRDDRCCDSRRGFDSSCPMVFRVSSLFMGSAVDVGMMCRDAHSRVEGIVSYGVRRVLALFGLFCRLYNRRCDPRLASVVSYGIRRSIFVKGWIVFLVGFWIFDVDTLGVGLPESYLMACRYVTLVFHFGFGYVGLVLIRLRCVRLD
jgi:hypothetical protein